MADDEQTVIVGAGPYGLSIAAHLRALGVRFRIFGAPMSTWREHMPAGMLLKSDGFASSLSDPAASLTLQHYCAEKNIPYDHTRIPVSLDTFIAYGEEFQRRFVPQLEIRQVCGLARVDGMFQVTLDSGENIRTQTVVLAVGITHFASIPEVFNNLPAAAFAHSSACSDLSRYRGKTVTVLGSGASGLDLAALLKEAGADVTLLTRNPEVYFHDKPGANPRSVLKKLRHPDSPIGPGWRSRFYTGAPHLFHKLPAKLRTKIVRTHLRPAAGWPMKERVLGKVPILTGYSVVSADTDNGRVLLQLADAAGQRRTHETEYVIAATGYRPNLRRIPFLDAGLLAQIRTVANSPSLTSDFQSSVPGLYFVGLAAANSFGPLLRFACGSDFAARHLTSQLAKRLGVSKRASSH